MYRDVLAIVLAGGRGSRLEPLTRDRAKPAVPFGGIYRIIDFTLSNCINSDLRKILVLTQYKATSLNRHIDQGWKFLCRRAGRVHRGDPAAAADRRDVVPGDGRRDLPERLHDREGRAAGHDDPGRRPHLQDELRADDRRAPRQPRRPDDRLPAGPAGPGERVRRDGRGRRQPRGQLPGEAQGPARPARPARDGAGLDGDLRLQHGRDVRAALPGRGAGRRPARTTSAATSSRRCSPAARGSSPTRSATRTARARPTGATWARSTPTTRPAWT